MKPCCHFCVCCLEFDSFCSRDFPLFRSSLFSSARRRVGFLLICNYKKNFKNVFSKKNSIFSCLMFSFRRIIIICLDKKSEEESDKKVKTKFLQNVLTFFIWDNIWPHRICALTWKCRCHISLLFTGFWWTKQKPSKVCSFRCLKRALFVGKCGVIPVIDILEILNEFFPANF